MAPVSSAVETHHPTVTTIVTGHFRESAGYATWRRRGTSDWLLICTVGGWGRFGFDGGEIIATAGDLVLLRPGTRHDYGVEPTRRRWDLLWSHFHPRPDWLEWLNWPEEAPGLMRLRLGSSVDASLRRRIVGRFREVHHRARGGLRRRDELAMNALEELLLWCDAINPRSEQAKLDERVRQAMDFLCRNLARKIALEEVAGHCAVSVSRLAHLFRQQTGTTPQQFLEQQRLGRAKQLLDLTSRSVKEIAHEVGFENPFYFTLRFKRWVGKSPKEYRGKTRMTKPE